MYKNQTMMLLPFLAVFCLHGRLGLTKQHHLRQRAYCIRQRILFVRLLRLLYVQVSMTLPRKCIHFGTHIKQKKATFFCIQFTEWKIIFQEKFQKIRLLEFKGNLTKNVRAVFSF